MSFNNNIIQQQTFYSLFFFIFQGFDYRILDIERITLTEPNLIQDILKDYHDSPIGGHQGFQRSYDKITTHYYWENMKTDIRDYIKTCSICQKSKTDFQNNKSPIQITTTSSKFCEQIAMDIVGPLPETINGNRLILTLQDDLTKLIDAYALQSHDAETVAIHSSR